MCGLAKNTQKNGGVCLFKWQQEIKKILLTLSWCQALYSLCTKDSAKRGEDMFRIGKFSELVHVSPRMLRYYEKCGLFYPAEIDKVNGYRLYSAAQIPLILRIVSLRDGGFTIEEISDILDGFEEKDNIENILNSKTAAIRESIAEEEKKIERLQAIRERIEKGNYTTTCQSVIIKSIPGIKVLSLREVVPEYSYQEELWNRLFAYVNQNNLYHLLAGNVIAVYHQAGYRERDIEIEVAMTVKELCVNEGGFLYKEMEPIACAATVVCDGPYEKVLPEGEGLLSKWIEDNGYIISGSERGFGIRHPGNEQDPQNYQTEIQLPIRKRI